LNGVPSPAFASAFALNGAELTAVSWIVIQRVLNVAPYVCNAIWSALLSAWSFPCRRSPGVTGT